MVAADQQGGGGPDFDDSFRSQLLTLLQWRRDVRLFQSRPVARGTIMHLLDMAALSPSVGLSQPWRYVLIDQPECRNAIRTEFERSNAEALADQPAHRAPSYARLKLAGLDTAPCHLAVFADPEPVQGHGLGRRTMPDSTAYSAVMAIHTLWLVARTEGLGVGWVSILDPGRVRDILEVPGDWTFVAYLCLGYPQAGSDLPELQRVGWERRSAAPWLLQR